MFNLHNPKKITRLLQRQFVSANKQGGWYQVSVPVARRALYALAEGAAPLDAQRELDRFILEVGGSNFGSRAYLLIIFSLLTCVSVAVCAGVLFGYVWWLVTGELAGDMFLFLSGMIFGAPAGISLAEKIGGKLKRHIFSEEIAEKIEQISRDYEKNFDIKVSLS